MRKRFRFLFALLLIASLVLSACGNKVTLFKGEINGPGYSVPLQWDKGELVTEVTLKEGESLMTDFLAQGCEVKVTTLSGDGLSALYKLSCH
ncbi:MAG: hypothetical protein UT34_C0002G0120 [candidate division WS6 bacterium GW2011_GWF2_39_15]|uniref:Uncharacterized protein n=1 Tax=candidate division WS6 bacterium GW2011_GWF2_39_15 TaxID=1619100 RepID=A0A0G0MR63_9BACT|nr:MAG: hypothetical protein UT34_C0002G0120 [candidate division WS6 bacterium GW2011_GWF2_39_15]